MEAYEHETRDVTQSFLSQQTTFPDCIAALDAALAKLIPRMPHEQLIVLRDLMLVNDESYEENG